jgi:rod shape-determining protein MreD
VTLGRVFDSSKVAALLFVAAIFQVSIFAPHVRILGGTPDVLLVTLVAVSLLRGTIVGAAGGFFAGLVVDTATLETLGLTSLLLTISGYWIGRYGETTGRDRSHAPFVSVGVVTLLYACGALIVHFMLGEHAPAGAVLTDVWPSAALNLVLTAPVYAVVRRLVRPTEWGDRVNEVRLLG